MWKLKNKLNKKYPDPPTAMNDEHENLITRKEEIQEQTLKYYQKVLENKTINTDLKDHQRARNELAKKGWK